MKPESKNINRFLLFLLTLIVSLPYLFLLWNYAPNIPHGDDFYAIIGFYESFLQEKSVFDKFLAFFYTSKEHINVVTRVISFLQYTITGSFDFRVYAFVGNLFLIGILIILYKEFIKLKYDSIFWFLPIPIILLNISYWEITIKGLMAIQHFGVIFFVLMALTSLVNKSKSIIWAMVFAVLAIYSFGNGFLVLFIGAIILYYQHRRQELIQWIIFSGVFLVLVAIQVYNHTSDGLPSLAIHHKIRFFFNLNAAFLGGQYLYSSFFVGLGLVTFMFYKVIKNKNNSSYFFISAVTIFIICSYLLVAIQRSNAGVMESFIARYPIYASLLMVLLYFVLLIEITQRKLVFFAAFFVALYININAWFTRFDDVEQRHILVLKGLQNWHCTQQNFWLRDGIDSPYNKEITNQFTWLNKSGLYEFPEYLVNTQNCEYSK